MAASPSTGKFFFYKWSTFIAMYAGYTLIVLNRKSFSFAVPAIREDVDLEKSDLGMINSSQNLAYTISKFLGGILSDTVSSKLLFSFSLLMSGALTASFTAFSSVGIFTVLWFCQGIVQGGAWPACAKILKQWFSPSVFATWYGILNTTMNVACSLGPIFTTYLTLHYGWRICMTAYGVLGIVVALGSMVLIADSPTDVGFQSFADEGKKDDKGRLKSAKGRGNWRDMLQSPFMWVICSSYCVVFLVRTAALDWGQLYLIEEAEQSQYVASGFISSMELGGFIGTIIAGYCADRLVALSTRDDTRGTPRMTVVICFVILFTISLHCFCFTINKDSSQLWISVIGFAFGFGLYGPISLYGVMAIESAPTHLSGTSHAIVSLACNIGAIAAGWPLSLLASFVEWRGAFIFLEVLSISILILKIATRNFDYKMVPIRKKLQ